MKKFLSYLLTFVITFLLTATGAIYMAKSADNEGFIMPPVDPSGAESTSFFTGIMSTFEENKQFNIEGDIALEYEDKNVNLNIYANFDITDMNNLKAEGILNADFMGENIKVIFSYFENTAYLSVNGVNVKVKVSSILDLVDLFTPKAGEGENDGESASDLDGMLEEMMPSIMNALSNPTTEELADGRVKNIIDIDGLVKAGIITDSKGYLAGVVGETYDLGGLKAKIDLDFNIDGTIKIGNPENSVIKKEYLDVSMLLDAVKDVASWNGVELNATLAGNVKGMAFNTGVEALINKNQNFGVKFNGSNVELINGLDISMLAGDLYITKGETKLLVSKALMNQMPEMTEKLMGLMEDSGVDLSKISAGVKDVDIQTILSLLGKIKSVENTKNTLTISGENFEIVITLDNLSYAINFTANSSSLSLAVSINETSRQVSVDNDGRLDLEKVIAANSNFYQGSVYSALLDLDIEKAGTNYFIGGNLDFDLKGAYVLAALNVYGGFDLDASVWYQGNDVYLKLGDAYVKLNVERFKQLLGKFGVTDKLPDLEKEVTVKLKDLVKNIKFNEVLDNVKALKNITINNDKIEVVLDLGVFGLEGEGTLRVNFVDGVMKFVSFENFKISDTTLNGRFEITSNEITKKTVDEEKYLDILETADKLIALKDINEASLGFALSGMLAGKDVELSGLCEFNLDDRYFKLDLNAIYGGDNVKLDLLGNGDDVYAALNDIKIKLQIQKVMEIVKSLTKGQDVDVNGTLDELHGNINLESFDVNMLRMIKGFSISSRGISVSLDGSLLGSNRDLKLFIALCDGMISSIEVRGLDIDSQNQVDFKIDLFNQKVKPQKVNESEYLDVIALAERLIALDNERFVNITGNVLVYSNNNGLYNKDYELSLALNRELYKKNLTLSSLISLVKGEKTINLNLGVYDNAVYASLNNLKVMIENSQIFASVHKVLSLLQKDTDKYDDLMLRVISILNGNTIKAALSGFDFDSLTDKNDNSQTSSNIDLELLIRDILNNTVINSKEIKLFISKEALDLDSDLDVSVSISESGAIGIHLNMFEVSGMAFDATLTIDCNETSIKVPTKEDREAYINIAKALELVDVALATIDEKEFSGNIYVDFMYGGEHNTVLANYGFKMVGGSIEAYISASFYGLSINIYLKNDTFYVDVGGTLNGSSDRVQVKAEFSEFKEIAAWLESTFGIKVNVDFNKIDSAMGIAKNFKLDVNSILNLLSSDLGFIKRIDFNESSLEAYFGSDMSVFINYDKLIKQVAFKMTGLYLEVNVSKFDEDSFAQLDLSTYAPYTELTNLVENVMKTLHMDPFEMYATVDMYKDAKLDATVIAGYQDEYLFANYEGLKVRIGRQSLAEILGVVLSLFGIDPSIVSFIGDVSSAGEIDFEHFTAIIPEFDAGNPFKMLRFLKAIKLNGGVLEVIIDGELLGSSDDMTIKLVTNDGKIESLDANNINMSGKTINAHVEFRRGIAETDYTSYIDFSNSADLVRALANTASLTDFHIQGNIYLSAAAIINSPLTVDARVIIDENNQTSFAIEIGAYPLIAGATAGNCNGAGGDGTFVKNQRHRTMTIYLRDGQFYLKTVDAHWKWALTEYQEQTRITKVSPAYLVKNLSYYVQWITGFTDMVQNAINDAINEAMNYEGETDYGNIIKGYEKNGNKHTFKINLDEIAHSNMLGIATVAITTTTHDKYDRNGNIVKDESGNVVKSDYIGQLDLDLNMLGGIIKIKTTDEYKLTLNGIGEKVDMSADNAFMDYYDANFNAYGEYIKTADGAYSQSNNKTITIYLDNNGGVGAESVSGNIATRINLPTPTKVVDDGITRKTYPFLGYFDANGNKFTEKSFGGEDVYLTAKWGEPKVEYYRTLTLKNGDNSDSIVKLEGTTLRVDVLSDYVYDDGVRNTAYTFVSWSFNGVLVGKEFDVTLGKENLTYEAVWSEETHYYHTITLVNNGNTTTIKNLDNAPILVLDNFEDRVEYVGDTKYVYVFKGWFVSQDGTGERVYSVDFNQDKTLYVYWPEDVNQRVTVKTLNVYDWDNASNSYKLISSERVTVGAAVSLPDLRSSYYVVDNYGVDQRTYRFSNYDKNLTVMPNENTDVYANYTEDEAARLKYFKVTYNVDWSGSKGSWSPGLGPDKPAETYVLQGTTFTTNATAKGTVYAFPSWTTYKCTTWSLTKGASSGSNSFANVQGDITLYAVWVKK